MMISSLCIPSATIRHQYHHRPCPAIPLISPQTPCHIPPHRYTPGLFCTIRQTLPVDISGGTNHRKHAAANVSVSVLHPVHRLQKNMKGSSSVSDGDRKRQRLSSPSQQPSSASQRTPHQPHHHHPSSDDADSDGERPCQAVRKRELERNRRNLINVRFSELDAELQRRSCDPASTAKSKRIDKEAVLKEACQKLSQQRKDLDSATERVTTMSAEIDNLRAEKVELRADKAYLRTELEEARSEVQRLRADNIHLWQSVQKASALKTQISSDLIKVPCHLFQSTQTQQPQQQPQPHQQPHQQHVPAPPQQQPPPPQPPPTSLFPQPQPQLQQQLHHNRHHQQQHRLQESKSASSVSMAVPTSSVPVPLAKCANLPTASSSERAESPSTPLPSSNINASPSLSSSPPLLSSPNLNRSANPNSSEAISPVVPGSTQNCTTDSFLIHQTPDEIGQFLANYYVPGTGAFATLFQPQPIQTPQPQPQSQHHPSLFQASLQAQTQLQAAQTQAQLCAQAQLQAQLNQSQHTPFVNASNGSSSSSDTLPQQQPQPLQPQHQPQPQPQLQPQPQSQQNSQVNESSNYCEGDGLSEITAATAQVRTTDKPDDDFFPDVAHCV